MKFTSTIVGAGALCAGTDAFVAPVLPVSGSFAAPTNSLMGSSTPIARPRSETNVVMSLSGGGSKKNGSPKGLSSKIIDIFRGNRSKG